MQGNSKSPEAMHVAMVAPPYFSIPPEAYGGIEEVVGDLTRALIARGHRVTLVGAGRDRTPAKFLRTYDEPPTDQLGEPLPRSCSPTWMSMSSTITRSPGR